MSDVDTLIWNRNIKLTWYYNEWMDNWMTRYGWTVVDRTDYYFHTSLDFNDEKTRIIPGYFWGEKWMTLLEWEYLMMLLSNYAL